MITLGVDMSKLTFYVVFPNEKAVVYENAEIGFSLLLKEFSLRKCIPSETQIGVESTGTYHLPFCIFLQRQGWRVTVLNPLSVSRMAATKLRPVKTDRLDAELIRMTTVQGAGYVFADSSETLKLKALVKERGSLVQIRAGLKQRLEAEHYRGEVAVDGYGRVLKVISEEIKQIERQLPLYEPEKQTLLRSIPGVGLVSAAAVTATVGDIKKFSNAKKLTAYLGLDCRVKESGTSVHGKGYLTKRGNKQLRHILFCSALIAKRYIPELGTFYEKKKGEGHHHFSALCATERKLINIIYAVWTRGTPFIQH